MNYRTLSIDKPLTKGELYQIKKRIDEIDQTLDLELDFLIQYLTKSMKLTMIAESGLRLVS